MCRKIAFFGHRAEILLSTQVQVPRGYLDSHAGPFLGYVKKYWFFGEIFTSAGLHSWQISIFSDTRRSRSDLSESLSESAIALTWLMWLWWVRIPTRELTDEEDEEDDKSYQVMKVIKWWKLSSDESYQVMKVILWWKFASDESHLVMEVC